METKLVYQNHYISIVVEEENHLLIDTWNEQSENLSIEEFKDLLLKFKEMVMENKVANVITDVSLFMFPMTPDLQEWSVDNITIPLLKESNYSQHAFVMPKDFIASLAIEQFTDETNKNAVPTRYFDNIEEAREWLLTEKIA